MGRGEHLLLSLCTLIILVFSSGCVNVGVDDLIEENEPIEQAYGRKITEEGFILELKVGNVSWIEHERYHHYPKMGVNISLKVSWEGDGNWSGAYPSSQQYNFTAKKDNIPVWDWAYGLGFLTIYIDFCIDSGTAMFFNDSWIFNNNTIEPGSYEIEGSWVPLKEKVGAEVWLAPIDRPDHLY